MGFDFDEKTGYNEEYDAQDGESTGEIGDKPVVERPRPMPARPPQQPAAFGNADEIVAAMFREAPKEEAQTVDEALEISEDEYMNKVEERLEVAAHYRLLLQDNFFEHQSKAAKLVTFELRAWVRERLAELVGMASPKKSALTEEEQAVVKTLAEFSPTQILALRMMADKAIPMFGLGTAQAATPKVEKVVQKAAAPALVKRQALAPAQGSAQPQPQPTAPEQRTKRPGPGRPPGSKNRVRQVEKKVVVNPNTGEEVEITNQQVQNPAGKIPFPADNAQMGAATYQVATRQNAETTDKNPLTVVALTTPA